jgi:hypothetical protein
LVDAFLADVFPADASLVVVSSAGGFLSQVTGLQDHIGTEEFLFSFPAGSGDFPRRRPDNFLGFTPAKRKRKNRSPAGQAPVETIEVGVQKLSSILHPRPTREARLHIGSLTGAVVGGIVLAALSSGPLSNLDGELARRIPALLDPPEKRPVKVVPEHLRDSDVEAPVGDDSLEFGHVLLAHRNSSFFLPPRGVFSRKISFYRIIF